MIERLILEFIEYEKRLFCVVKTTDISYSRILWDNIFLITHETLNAEPEFADNC